MNHRAGSGRTGGSCRRVDLDAGILHRRGNLCGYGDMRQRIIRSRHILGSGKTF